MLSYAGKNHRHLELSICRCSSLAANVLHDFAEVGCASNLHSSFWLKIKWMTSKSRLSCISLYWKKKTIFSIIFSYFISFDIFSLFWIWIFGKIWIRSGSVPRMRQNYFRTFSHFYRLTSETLIFHTNSTPYTTYSLCFSDFLSLQLF